MADHIHSSSRLAGVALTAVMLLLSEPTFADQPARVFCTNGNVVLIKDTGDQARLTESGLDFDPVSSPDGKTVAFARRTPGYMIEAAVDPEDANEIWVVGIDGKGARKMAEGRKSDQMEEVLTGICNPAFSPDGRSVYFLSSAWVTSRAIHRIRLKDTKISFVASGNTLEVVKAGEHKGCLVARQHRYWLAGGTYDWYWLLTADGKEVGPIGDEGGLSNFHDFYWK